MTRLVFALVVGWIAGTAAFCSSTMAADSILIEFSSAHCPPCRAMKPILAQLERSGVPVRHVDVEAEPGLTSRFGIRQTPTFVVVSGGREVTRLVGTRRLEELQAALALDPRGPLVPTRSRTTSPAIAAPQTRLAPLRQQPLPQARTETLVSANSAPPASEPMPSVSQADGIERARAATVRLRAYDGQGYGAGTGTIIDTHGDEALVLTCGHLFRETDGKGKIEVDLFVGGQTRTVAGQVIDYEAEHRDIALVVIRPGFAVQPVALIGGGEKVRNGQPAFSFGCDRGADPSRRDTRITGVNKYDQHLGVSNLEIAGAPIDGRSGGGLFDSQGRLIGVCNAADYEGDVGIYSGPGNIEWQLERVGMSRLMEGSAAGLASATPPAPAERLASTGSLVVPASAVQPSAIRNISTADREVIVIIRDKNDPNAEPQVMTLQSPSNDLMQMIESGAK